MKIDLKRTDSAPATFDLEIKAEDIELEADLARVDGTVNASGIVSNGDELTIVEADVLAPLVIDCSRCLAKISFKNELSFRTAFAYSDDLTDEQEVELDLEDLELSIAEEDEVDLVDIIREQLMLSLPARPLCSEDCKGLCEVCGGDLNKVDCNCKQEETDPRWAALKDLNK
jgi:uncharacterized protein